jgi:hypothetical protein
MARPKKRVTKKMKELARGALTPEKRGRILGEFAALKRVGQPIVFAAIARAVGVRAHTVAQVIRDADGAAAGGVGGGCKNCNLSNYNTARSAKAARRRVAVAKIALRRVVAADGSARAPHDTLRGILGQLPPDMQPESTATICRDLFAEGVHRLSTVSCPLMGEQWKLQRKLYAAGQLKAFPCEKHLDALIASDETLISTNNVATKKEWRRKKTKPMLVKKQPHPPQIMVWLAIGVGYKKLVVHPNKQRKGKGEWKTKCEMVKKCKIKVEHVRPGARYSKERLLQMSAAEKKEWLMLERKWDDGCGGRGVNGRAYGDSCLLPLLEDLKKLGGRRKKQMYVLEDNSPVHTSNFATVLKSLTPLKFIAHPPYSCDMNPAEFANNWLKTFVSNEAPTTEGQLITAIKKGFAKISQKNIDAWMRAYWGRLSDCANQKGEWVGSRECRQPKAVRSDEDRFRPTKTTLFFSSKGRSKKTL